MRNHNFQEQYGNGGDDDEQVVLFQAEGKTDADRYIDMVEAGLSANEINQNTLNIALNILQKSVWWRFRSNKSKMKMIEEIYEQLTRLI